MAIAGVRDLRRTFPGVVALDGVSVDFQAGAVHALLGENGSGKSTLVKILSGALAPSSGTVVVDGRAVVLPTPRAAIEAGIVTSYQDSALVPHLTVADNVLLGHEPSSCGVVHRSARAIAQGWLDEIGAEIDARWPTSSLSVGGQQMVAIAKALSLRSRLFIFDEPTAALTDRETRRLFALIDTLRARGLGIIYITHRLSEVDELADTISVLKDGRLVATMPASEVDQQRVVTMMVGRKIDGLFPARRSLGGGLAMVAEGVESLRPPLAIERVELHRGEILGLAGVEGSGRTELARFMGGIDGLARGTLTVGGRHLRRHGPRHALAARIGYVPPDRLRQAIVAEFTVGASVTQSALQRFTRFGVVNGPREQRAAGALVERLNVRPTALGAAIRTLSGGNQQKVVLARALCAEVEVLVCDEPTAGVDVGARAEIYALLDTMARRGVGIVVSSSDLLELSGLCDRVLVLRAGVAVAELAGSRATEEALLRAQLLPRAVESAVVT